MSAAATKTEHPKAPIPVVAIPHLEEFCRQVGIGPAARKLLRPALTPWGYFGRLLANESYPDAIRFLAHTLSKRSAVWWGALCVHQAFGSQLGPKQALALEAVVRWVREPNADSAKAAEAAGKAAGIATAAGCLAMSTHWSSLSHTPPEMPGVPADLLMTANTIAGVVTMAAAEGPPAEFKARQRGFLSLGISVANRELLWNVS